MRAAKHPGQRHPADTAYKEIHISGAEGLYSQQEIPAVAVRYIERAFTHAKGKADKVIITVERLKQRAQVISSLPVSTVISRTPDEGGRIVQHILTSLGITIKAVQAGVASIQKGGMRGAAIISGTRGISLAPDKLRGVRASRLGVTSAASRRLSERLALHNINTDTVKEALILASKVISHKDVIAELCISDDPDYTTGYVASQKLGYVRIPRIKRKNSTSGGRVFFVREGADIAGVIDYLERMPVLVGKVAPCKGPRSLHEILNNPNS